MSYMASRKISLSKGEYYHIYNRGVDKRNIFSDEYDVERFLQSMVEFNVEDPIGSIYENSFKDRRLRHPVSKLVYVIAYCLNPNHYHFILKQVAEKGVEKYMQRLGMGYAKYFNNKNDRSGSLFQGAFKSVHVGADSYFKHLSAYVNLNNKVHYQLGHPVSKLVRSSWGEYMGENNEMMCEKEAVLKFFRSRKDYKKFALKSIQEMIVRRRKKEWKRLFLE